MNYYTYAYLREDKNPYYIGKGTGGRIYKKGTGEVNPPKDKSRIIYLKQNLTEEEAFKHEIYMIAFFGRIDLGTGILRNKTNGGEGTSGIVKSEETRKKISEAGRGRTHSEETRKKIGKAHKGKTASEETRKRMSDAHKGENHHMYGKTTSEETRKKISEATKGNTHWLGKTRSEETKIKISEAQKGKTYSEEHRRKISEAGKDRKWWNDGCGNRKRVIECPGDGWKLGRR